MRCVQALTVLGIVLCARPVNADSWHLGEGYSSQGQGLPAEIYYRQFTLSDWQDICAKAPFPTAIKMRPNPIRLRVGQKLRLGPHSDVSVEAVNGRGIFLKRVPISVEVDDPHGTVHSRDDWDYLKAIRKGRAKLTVHAYCGTEKIVVAGSATMQIL